MTAAYRHTKTPFGIFIELRGADGAYRRIAFCSRPNPNGVPR